jgi:hypothetical protein
MKTGVKIGLIIGGATLLIGGTIFAVVKMTKKDDENVGDGQSNADWLIATIGDKNVKGLYNLYVWYRDNTSTSSPMNSARWDLHTNHTVGGDSSYDFTIEQNKAMNEKGISDKDIIDAYEKIK